MKRLITAAALSVALLAPLGASAFWGADGGAAVDQQSLVDLRIALHKTEVQFAREYDEMLKGCADQGCVFVGLAGLYSKHFKEAGFSYDATVRAYIEAINTDPQNSGAAANARMDGILTHLMLLARLPQFEAERNQLLKSGVLTEKTVKAARAMKAQ